MPHPIRSRPQVPPRSIARDLGRWLLDQPPSICAVGLGLRRRGGRQTAEPVAVVLVDTKRPRSQIPPAERVPPVLSGWPTDVRSAGVFSASSRRERPVLGGLSVGHCRGESGTVACMAWSWPRRAGERPLLLSNNHVLTRYGQAQIGDSIIQPAQAELGYAPGDTVATLKRWVPLELDPPIPSDRHHNRVDAAVAEVIEPGLIRPEIKGLGPLRSWRAIGDIPIGLPVAKSGATSGCTEGVVEVIEATARMRFYGVGTAVMHEQILVTQMSHGGDSGALVVSAEPGGWSAVGLICGASRAYTMVNPIEVVQELLAIRVSEVQWSGPGV